VQDSFNDEIHVHLSHRAPIVFNLSRNEGFDRTMKYPDTQFLRAIAIILILNSHLDRYYPIPFIATGGAIGNSIFFFLSGFGTYLSQQKRTKHFTEWYAHRVARIYPSLWIVLLLLKMPLMIMDGKLSLNTVMPFIGEFFSPPYPFLLLLLVYYLLGFPLLGNLKKSYILVILSLLSLVYIGCYITIVDLSKWSVEKSPFDLIHYFMVFMFGIYIAKKNKDIAYSGFHNYLLLILIFSLIYMHKFIMTKGLCFQYQFLQQAAMYPLVYYLLKISRSNFIVTKVMGSKKLSQAFEFLSNNTLEIYIVEETIIYPILKLELAFPINIFVLLISTLGLSAIITRLSNRIRESIQ
jgi:hypothetical protein